MTAGSCGGVRRWLHVDRASLSDADQLVLESHLEGCAACRDDRARLRQVQDVAAALPFRSLGAQGQARAISAALLRGARSTAPAPSWSRWWMVPAIGAVAAVIVILSGVVTWRGDHQGQRAAVEALDAGLLLAPTVTSAVVDGEVRAGDRVLAPGDALPVQTPLAAATAVQIALGDARASFEPGAAFRWDQLTRTVWLDDGAVEVAMEPGPRHRLRVTTPRYTVEVTGTIFRVSADGVAVTRGSVRITDPDGAVLVERLGAGGSWQPAPPPTPPPAGTTAASDTAATWLRRARRSFEAGHLAAATRGAEAALAARPTRTEAAAAHTILADCAQAGGEVEDAIVRYLVVSEQFSDLAAAESALFAAARLQARAGRAAAAATLFRRYLERYPSGRFVEDARRRAHP